MKIIIYSTDSMKRHDTHTSLFPAATKQLEEFLAKRAGVQIEVLGELEGVAEAVASTIAAHNPDLAMAFSTHKSPLDWDVLKDALVARKLQARGIRTVSPTVFAAQIFFDKWETFRFLSSLDVLTPRTILADRSLMLMDSGETDYRHNPYKEFLFDEVARLRFPVVIKDTHGISSYHLEVCNKMGEARNYLTSKRCKCSKVIQEYVAGTHIAVEVYACGDGRIVQGVPFALSLNQYGVTSPRFNAKVGLVGKAFDFLQEEVREVVRQVVVAQDEAGVFQFDFVLGKSGLTLLEVNTRPGGVTLATLAAFGKHNIFDLVAFLCPEIAFVAEDTAPVYFDCREVLEFKLPVLDDGAIKEATAAVRPFAAVPFVYRVQNTGATQRREEGYTQFVLSIADLSSKSVASVKDAVGRVLDKLGMNEDAWSEAVDGCLDAREAILANMPPF